MIAFPVALDGFFRTAPIMGGTFLLDEASETLTLGGGEVLGSQVGVRLWRGTAEFAVLSQAEREDAMAMVHVLQRVDASFLVTPLHAQRPGAGTALLNGVQNGRELRLSGAAAGLALPRGAFLSWTYGSNPVRYAFHQLAEPLTADGTGLTGYAEVSPAIRAGFAIGATVQVAGARLKARMVPKSLRPARSRKSSAEGLAFDWVQTLR